jgi:hypothetical protein
MSPDSTGTLVPTVLEIHLTGVRNVVVGEVTVTINGTDIAASAVRPNRNMYGYDIITFTLPSTLAASGSVPISVRIIDAAGRGTFTSRSVDTAPKITIN